MLCARQKAVIKGFDLLCVVLSPRFFASTRDKEVADEPNILASIWIPASYAMAAMIGVFQSIMVSYIWGNGMPGIVAR